SLGNLIDALQRELNVREKYEASSLMDIGEYIGNIRDGLFDSIVVIENYPIDCALSEKNCSLKIQDYYLDYFTHYQLSVVISTFNEIHITFTSVENAFDQTALERIAEYLRHTLNEIVDNPDQSFATLRFLPRVAKDIHRRLNAETHRKKDTICELFETQVSRAPHRVALRKDNLEWTYSEIEERVRALARQLHDRGVKKG